MNGDLISREALLKELKQRHLDDVFINRGLPPLYKMSLECNRALETQGDAIRDVINGLPAVDAEPVRHGKWIKGGYVCGDNEWKCSVCGETEWRGSADWMKFCMYCGAKMDEEGENENE